MTAVTARPARPEPRLLALEYVVEQTLELVRGRGGVGTSRDAGAPLISASAEPGRTICV